MAEWTKVSPIGWTRGLTISAAIALLTGAVTAPTMAQTIREDNTLGNENSRVVRNVRIRGVESDRIEGGATRGQNLFHSFLEFNVPAGRGAYFLNPDGIRNIFGRVTGGGRSEIFGNLGLIRPNGFLGNANLFLINPNGILFGRTAHLDLGGAFVGTTANAIQFGNLGNFSATEPNLPTALTISPSAFLFNQINTPAGEITVNANQPAPWNYGSWGLQVMDEQNLTLVGRTVTVDGAQLNAFGGRVNLAAITIGTVGLAENGSLTVPTSSRGNITVTNEARIDVLSSDNGDITLIGRNINVLDRSTLSTGIFSGLGTSNSQAGNLTLNATGAVQVTGGSRIENIVDTNSRGNSGNISITANSLEVTDGSQLSASTFGQGNAGNVILNVGDRISLEGTSRDGQFASAIFSNVETGGTGNGGNIQLSANSLTLSNGGRVTASTRGRGNAGNVTVNVRDRVSLEGTSSAIFSAVSSGAVGNGGNIQLSANSLTLSNGAELVANSFGQGHAGNVTVNVRSRIFLEGLSQNGQVPSGVFSSIGPRAVGNGGNIQLSASSLTLSNGAQLAASTFGRGRAGNVTVNVRDRISLEASSIFSTVESGAVGNGGNIQLSANSFILSNGSQLVASTFGRGNASDIAVTVRDRISLEGISGKFSSVIFSTVESGAVGNGGNIQLSANSLTLSNDASLSAGLRGRGIAGNVTVTVRNRVSLGGRSTISSIVASRAVGSGGNIQLTANSLTLNNDSRLSASTFGQGHAGNVTVTVRDRISLEGGSGIFSTVGSGAVGNGGNIQLSASSLTLSNEAQLAAGTRGRGNSGNVIIDVRDLASNNGDIFSSVSENAVGNGGNIKFAANSLTLSNGAQFIASTSGCGNAGNVNVIVRDRISLEGTSGRFSSGIFSTVQSGAVGNGGNIAISARSIFLANRSRISASTSGRGNAGNIAVQTEQTQINNGTISTAVNAGAMGRGGDIDLQTRSLNLINQAEVTASTSGQGNAGSIDIRNAETIALKNRSRISSAVNPGAVGQGGRIEIRANTLQLNDRSQISSAIDRNTTGQGGRIRIQTGLLTLGDRSQISASSAGRGDTGRINIQAIEAIGLSDRAQITSRVGRNAVGNSQGITLDTPQLILRGNAAISAATNGNGSAGDITIRNADRVSLSNSTLSTAVESNGGRLNVSNPDESNPDESNSDGLSRSRSISDRQGNITIETRSLRLNNGSRITTNTAGRDNAGDVVIRNADIVLSESVISTAVTQPSTQQGGTIRIVGRSLTLDNARINASSQTQGNPGDLSFSITGDLTSRNSQIRTNASGDNTSGGRIDFSVGDITLIDSPITTTATGNNAAGGTIRLNANDIRLQGDSDIQTNVSSGAGDGGDISLSARSILAFDDSDIISSAPDRAGDITLNTPAFFGAGYQFGEQDISPNGNDRVDVNATGTVSNGAVTLPNTDFVQNNLGELPQTAFDASEQLQSNSCIIRDSETRLLRLRNRFTITGGGGFPLRPGNANQHFSTGEVQTIPTEGEDTGSWQPGEAIVEPQGVYQLPNGRLILSRECSAESSQAPKSR